MSERPARGLPRALEAVLALGGLVAVWPLLVMIAAAIKLSSPGPVLFRQRRVGRGGRAFELLKFRTMRLGSGGTAVTARGDRRITAVGRLLRHSKLDELPELWNIVRGDMSIVGPRPEVPAFVDLEDGRWQRVLAVRPGLTDPVTLRLRDEESLLASFDDPEDAYGRWLVPWKLRGYLDYLERRSPGQDLGVIVATLRAIVDPASVEPPTVAELQAES